MNVLHRLVILSSALAAVSAGLVGCASSEGARKQDAPADSAPAAEEGAAAGTSDVSTQSGDAPSDDAPMAETERSEAAERPQSAESEDEGGIALPWPFGEDEAEPEPDSATGGARGRVPPPSPRSVHTSRARRFFLRPTLDSTALSSCRRDGRCSARDAPALSALIAPQDNAPVLDMAVLRSPDGDDLYVVLLAQGPPPLVTHVPTVIVDDTGLDDDARAYARAVVEALAARAPGTRMVTVTEAGSLGVSPVDSSSLDAAFALSRPRSLMPRRLDAFVPLARSPDDNGPLLVLSTRDTHALLDAAGNRTVSVVNLRGTTEGAASARHSLHDTLTPPAWVVNSLFVTCAQPQIAVQIRGANGIVASTSGTLATTALAPGVLAAGNRTAMVLKIALDPRPPGTRTPPMSAAATLRCTERAHHNVFQASAAPVALAAARSDMRDALALALFARGEHALIAELGLIVPDVPPRDAL